jgi:putative transposase
MARKRYKPEEIVAKLRQVDVLVSQGQNMVDAIRQIGVSEVTYYRWRQEFGGLKSEQVKRLKDLELENSPSRSVIKTREDAPCSRCRRRSARISSPCIGWTLGEPFFALRTCSRPVASSTCDHCRSHNSDARKPWR